MRVVSKPYGAIDVDERQKIYFPFGLFGFENFKNYVLLDAKQQPFYWLQSTDVAEIAFLLINPKIFRTDYELDIEEEELAEINIKNDEDILCFTIVTIPENPSKMTANLQGPIIINRKTREARQSIMRNQKWKIRHSIIDELMSLEQKSC
ncbi:MAG: flagellar assembly protein FliW [Spirochaetales bacterium]|nr:flagellar assembly protein FliW [Spirochaetales bacterium]